MFGYACLWGTTLIDSTFFLKSVHLSTAYAETAARDSLEQVISEALVESGSDKSHVRGVCLGVSGVNHPSDQDMIQNWIRCYSSLFDIVGRSSIISRFLPLCFFVSGTCSLVMSRYMFRMML